MVDFLELQPVAIHHRPTPELWLWGDHPGVAGRAGADGNGGTPGEVERVGADGASESRAWSVRPKGAGDVHRRGGSLERALWIRKRQAVAKAQGKSKGIEMIWRF